MNNQLNISAAAHPFAVERIDYTLPLGLSLAEIIESVQPDPALRRHVHAFINGDYVPMETWPRLRPKREAIVTLRMVPQGGGDGKNPLRTILSIALIAATPYLGAMLGAGLATQFGGVFSLSLTQKLLIGGLNFVGRLALNAVAPPSQSRVNQPRETRTRYIQGSRNGIEPFGSLPQVLGTHRIVPPLGAKPYTETHGNDQYVRMLFVWGHGPLEIGDLKIGETPLDEFDEVEIETRTGAAGDAPLSLFSDVVLQNDLQVKLENSSGYELRTTAPDIDELSVDVTFPNGLVHFSDSGTRLSRSAHIEVQYAPTGTNDWTAGAVGYKAIMQQSLTPFSPPGVFGFAPAQAGYEYRFYKRIDSIVIDRAGGLAAMVIGEKQCGYDVNGAAGATAKPVKPPIIPEGKIEIARLTSLGDQTGLSLSDCRDVESVGDVYENENDFTTTFDGAHITVAAGGLRFNGIEVQAKQSVSLRRSLRFKVPKGQYDVRLRRITPDSTDENIFDDVFWTALRSIRDESPVQVDGLAVTALRIRATDQLNGRIDQFNGVVTSIIPDWDGLNWIPRPSANPASLLRHVLQGSANARPLDDARLDLEKLQDWHTRCAANNRNFNAVIGGGQSVMDVVADIAAAGRASPTIIDGRWGVVEDLPQTVPVQHFTPRNTRGFEGERGFEDLPHALRVKFNNRDKGWQLDERIVYDDGYSEDTASKFESLDLTGVTDSDQAWRDGRYHLASARLRSEIYSFHTDIEHIVCTRGDLIRLTHDVAMAGLASARVKTVLLDGSGYASGVTLDSEVELETGKSYVLRIRTDDGSSLIKPVINTAGVTYDLNFQAVHSGLPLIQQGDLCLFGEAGSESLALIVKSIEPQDEMSAKITCVDAAASLHDSDQGEVPLYESRLSAMQENRKPPAPLIHTIQSGTEAIQANTDGSFSPRIIITLVPPAESGLELNIQVKPKSGTTAMAVRIERLDHYSYAINDVEEGEFYDLTLKYIRAGGMASDPTMLANYEVIGLREPPGAVENFALSLLNETAHLSWTPVSDIDLSHYHIKYSSDLNNQPGWNTAVDLVPMIPKAASTAAVPALSGYYIIKAVDLGGRESGAARFIRSDIPTLAAQNVIVALDQHPGFTGGKDNTVAVGGILRLGGEDSIDDWMNLDLVADFDLGEQGYAISGSYDFDEVFDLGAVYSANLRVMIGLSGMNMSDTLDIQPNIDAIEYWDNDVPPDKWHMALQISTTEDDPNDLNAIWSAWSDFKIGFYKARGFKFQALLSSGIAGITPAISMLSVIIDMPDRIISGQNILADSTGETVTFLNPFRQNPLIAITGENLQSGDRHEITNVSPAGFTVRFFDQSDTPVSRSFDYLAKGFGYRV